MAPYSILVVDEEPMIRTLLRRAIAAPGIRIFEADSSESAFQFTSPRGGFDLVITDLLTGRMGGVEFAVKLASIGRARKFLFLSVDAEDELALECTARIQPSLFLQKPFAIADLLRSVHNLLEPAHEERLVASVRHRVTHACLRQLVRPGSDLISGLRGD